jgi:hypothetical protein
LIVGFLQAAPIINPAMPALIEQGFAIPDTRSTNPQFAFVGDCLLEKKMHKHSTQSHIVGTSESGALIWNILERLNLQAAIGSGHYTWKLQQKHFKNISGTLWSGDVKLIIFNVKDLHFAIDGQIGGWNATKAHIRYWQVSPGFSYRAGALTPYLGCAINRTIGKFSRIPKTIWFHEDDHLGPFVGLSYSRGNWFLANLEWRGVFETGISALAQVRF